MRVKIKIFASLINYVPGAKAGIPFDFEVNGKESVADLIKHLKIPQREVAIVFINGKNKPLKHQLNNDDEMSIFPLIGGG